MTKAGTGTGEAGTSEASAGTSRTRAGTDEATAGAGDTGAATGTPGDDSDVARTGLGVSTTPEASWGPQEKDGDMSPCRGLGLGWKPPGRGQEALATEFGVLAVAHTAGTRALAEAVVTGDETGRR